MTKPRKSTQEERERVARILEETRGRRALIAAIRAGEVSEDAEPRRTGVRGHEDQLDQSADEA